MPRRPSAKVVLNRAALDSLHLALAEGVEEICRTIVETADPPDATPFGAGLVKQGGWAVYAGSKKVGGGSLQGSQPKKPRSLVAAATGITGFAGFGFPGRFVEFGTSDTPAQPFLTPAVQQVIPHAARIVKAAVGARLGRR